MDIIFDVMSGQTFWKILLFLHFLLAVALLATVTLQALAVLMPAQQAAGDFIERLRPVPAVSYTTAIVVLYALNFVVGAWVYVKYRTYVRIPMEQLGHWWTVGSFEFKEHVITMGIAVLPAYWYFWRQSLSDEHVSTRRWLTLFLAFTVWYSFLIGHIANDFRGVGS
jgi:hypothetical protein